MNHPIMNWLFDTLRSNPEIAIFLALALGFWIGGMRLGKFSLGNVTGVLLAGVLIGQLNITISPNVKAVFFLMFLFAVGYGVGPQFFRGLKSDGLPQVFFAVILCVSCLLCAFIAAKVAGYNMGQAAGLLSGACTISAVLGVASDTMGQIGLTPDQHKAMVDAMPVAYAVTYLFGTAGSAWFLASIGPKLLGVNLAKECAEYEAKMGGAADAGDQMSAYRRLTTRAYQVQEGSKLAGKTVAEFEAQFSMPRVFIMRLRQASKICDTDPKTIIRAGDILGLAGPRELLLKIEAELGPEVDDRELFDVPIQLLDVVITNKEFVGKTLLEIRNSDAAQQVRGVFLRKLIRTGQEMPFNPGTKVDRGDVVQIVGPVQEVEKAAKRLGYADRATDKTDMVFMGLGIVIGALIGAIVIKLGQVPLSLSTSGGALFAGLVCGWLRSVNPTFGRIPGPALWVFNNIGLTAFIAVVGISCGPSFVAGLKAAGISLFLWGVFVTTVPFVVGIFTGKYLFKMHPGIILGACAGARTTTAALGAIQDEAKSKVPALSYTVTYAVGNVLLITWGVVIVLLMK
ncbi:MAG TPA: aspartate-alanine antiporter [Candidatus Acidoferrales bacterium]|nr:aspartate-alanine antiporter [Candidatus Acidoferrales bacterium]